MEDLYNKLNYGGSESGSTAGTKVLLPASSSYECPDILDVHNPACHSSDIMLYLHEWFGQGKFVLREA